MKKFLSLVLALVMTMSLVTVSAGAKDFTDDSKITYKEAVDVLSAVKVIDGYADGSFNPTATLTRGAAAKIICNLILGPTTAGALVANAAPFSDVPADNGFAGYIAYCAKEGIVGGYADGTFRPTNTLTGYAFMKMLLGALGYNADTEGYNNPTNWSIAVAKRALSEGVGLDDGLVTDFNGVKAVTREEACLYAFNMMKATMVEYENDTTIVAGNVTVQTKSKAKEVANTSKNDGNIKDDDLMQFAEKYFVNLKGIADTDDFKRPATTWKVKTEKIGTYVKDADVSYSTEVEYGDIYADLGLSATAKITEAWVDGKDNLDNTYDKVAKKDDDHKIGANGVLTEVWYDDDNDTAIVSCINTYVGKVGSVTKATSSADRYITMSAYSQNKPAGLDTKFETEEFAKDDLVTYTAAYNKTKGTYEIQEVAELTEKASGTLTEWNGKTYNSTTGNSENNFTAGGTTYKYSNKVVVVDEDDHDSDIWNFEVDKSDLNVYVDQYGYAIYVSGVEGSKNYAVVIGIGNTNSYGSAKNGATLLLPDGSIKEVKYTMKKNSGALSSTNTVSEGTGDLVTYTVKDDGTYELNLAGVHTAQSTTATTEFKNGKSAFTLNGQTYYATSETVFFVVTGDKLDDSGKLKDLEEEDYEVYTGYANMPGFLYDHDGIAGDKNVEAFAVVSDADYNKQAEYVYIVAKSLEGVSDVDTYFVKKKNAEIRTDSTGTYYILPAIVDGVAAEVKVDADAFTSIYNAKNGTSYNGTTFNSNVIAMFAIKNVVKDSHGIITRFTDVTDNTTFNVSNGAAGTVAANRVVLGLGSNKASAAYWAYDEDTNVYVIDKDYKTIEISSVADIETDANDLVYAIYDTNQKVLTDVVIVKQDDVAVSSDTSIKKITAKGVVATLNAGTYEVTVSATANANREEKLVVETNDANATVSVKIKGQDKEWTGGSNQGAYQNTTEFVITVTAVDGSVDTYALKVVKEAAPVLTCSAAGNVVAISGDNINLVASASGTTVDELLSVLSAEGWTVSAVKTNGLGGTSAVAGDTALTNGTTVKVVLTSDTTGDTVTYNVAVAES